MTSVALVIPFRDRGTDPNRPANLDRIIRHWADYSAPVHVVDDGGTGDDLFNRSRAYNRALAAIAADVYVFTESDMLVDYAQINTAVELAAHDVGLVVPFTEYRYLDEGDSAAVRTGRPPRAYAGDWVMTDGRSIGAVNVVSRATMDAVGCWDETFTGAWFDDNAMAYAFDVAAAPTRWVDGPAWHLYHLSGARGRHVTPAERAATARNRRRLALYRRTIDAWRIRELTAGAD